MKCRTIFVTVLFLLFAAIGFSQEFENESEFYTRSLQIYQIASHALGYRVDYLTHDATLETLWLPNEWFNGRESVGTISSGRSAAYPYMSLFYKDGVLDHFRLYLMSDTRHSSWGLISFSEDFSENFPAALSDLEIIY